MSIETKISASPVAKAKTADAAVSISVSTERVAKYSQRVREKFKEMFGIKGLQFTNVELRIEIRGVPTVVPNLLRATIIDGIKGRALVPGKIVTTDPHILEQLVHSQLAGIRMRPQIPDSTIKEVKFQ